MDFGVISFSTLCKIYSCNLSGSSCVDAGFCVSLGHVSKNRIAGLYDDPA